MKSSRYFADHVARYTMLICGVSSFAILLAIAVFIVVKGLPAFREVNPFEFLFGTVWRPGSGQYGILAMIIGSIAVTFGALLIAIPLGIACAILLSEIAPFRIRQLLRPAVELLVGIPSVVYGLVGLVILVPAISRIGGSGFSLLAASIVLAVMVMPTIISISEDSLRAVPSIHKEGALALGATHWQTIWRVLLPSAKSGIIASIVLAMGRAIGETMAMIMVIGNAIKIPTSILDPGRTLTGNIAVEINYASGTHASALFATGIVLFIFIAVLNSIVALIFKRGSRSYAEHLT
ncbi:MAG: phosphate ABC transporter permease subunit PstC [Dehalococcoidales bacterium]|nr:phosphate ABC transporter permease subunit PstC [Dehalococcoidales bacterium]